MPLRTPAEAISHTRGPVRTGRRPTARSSATTARCSRNGPTLTPIPAKPTARLAYRRSCITTISTAATPRYEVPHPQTAYTTCVDSTPSHEMLIGPSLPSTVHRPSVPFAIRVELEVRTARGRSIKDEYAPERVGHTPESVIHVREL